MEDLRNALRVNPTIARWFVVEIFHLFGWLFHLLIGHYVFAGIMRCEGGEQGKARWVILSRIRRQKIIKQARRYIPHALA